MQSKDLLLEAIHSALGITLPLLEDLKDAPMTFPTTNQGNHPTWIAGHLAHSAGVLVWSFMRGQENPMAEWDALFNMGTEPQAEASLYPEYRFLIEKLQAMYQEAIALLETLDEAALDQESVNCPEQFKNGFGTWRKCYLALAQRLAMHRGQLCDTRRALQRQPVMA